MQEKFQMVGAAKINRDNPDKALDFFLLKAIFQASRIWLISCCLYLPVKTTHSQLPAFALENCFWEISKYKSGISRRSANTNLGDQQIQIWEISKYKRIASLAIQKAGMVKRSLIRTEAMPNKPLSGNASSFHLE
jgi:hypothetical protein